MKAAALMTAFLLMVSMSTTALAEVRIKQYEQVKSTEWFSNYVEGVAAGLVTANAMLRIKQRPLLFCPPEQSLAPGNYRDILDEMISKNKDQLNPDAMIQDVLLVTLIQHYPCEH